MSAVKYRITADVRFVDCIIPAGTLVDEIPIPKIDSWAERKAIENIIRRQKTADPKARVIVFTWASKVRTLVLHEDLEPQLTGGLALRRRERGK